MDKVPAPVPGGMLELAVSHGRMSVGYGDPVCARCDLKSAASLGCASPVPCAHALSRGDGRPEEGLLLEGLWRAPYIAARYGVAASVDRTMVSRGVAGGVRDW